MPPIFRWRDQRGSGQVMFSLALVAVAGGVAAYMATNDERSIRQAQIQGARDNSQAANNTNLGALAALMRFPSDIPLAQQVASNPDYLPSVYPDPYIYGSSPGNVRLASVKKSGPGAGARWGTNGQGIIAVQGYNSGRVSDSALDAVFQSGGSLQATANQQADSKISLSNITPYGSKIAKIQVASLGYTTDSKQNTYQDTIQAELTVPLPPPPEVKSSGQTAVIGWGQKATISFQGYGLMTSFVAYPLGNENASCRLPMPPEANSIRNSANGGFPLGSCSFAFQNPDMRSGDPTQGFITILVNATGPGGNFQGSVQIPAYSPPRCVFNRTDDRMSSLQSLTIGLTTVGAVTGAPQLNKPVNTTADGIAVVSNAGWQPSGTWTDTQAAGSGLWTGQFQPGVNFGQATIYGRVTGPALKPGTWQDCDNIERINIDQSVCYEHGDGTYRYINQCYTRADGYSILWTTTGPYYNKCQGYYWGCRGCWCGTTHFRNMGCFTPETQIQLADGSTRRIDELQAGDLIHNPLTGRPAKLKGMVKGPEKEPMIELGYDGKVVHVTTKHPMLTLTGVKAAMDLKLGEEVLGADKKFHRLTDLRRLPVDPEQQVYNFVMDDADDSPSHHVVVADGILTGDLQLQQELEKRTKAPSKVARD